MVAIEEAKIYTPMLREGVPPQTPWRLFDVYVFSFFFPCKQAFWYIPNLFFCLLRHWSFQSWKPFGVYFSLRPMIRYSFVSCWESQAWNRQKFAQWEAQSLANFFFTIRSHPGKPNQRKASFMNFFAGLNSFLLSLFLAHNQGNPPNKQGSSLPFLGVPSIVRFNLVWQKQHNRSTQVKIGQVRPVKKVEIPSDTKLRQKTILWELLSS